MAALFTRGAFRSQLAKAGTALYAEHCGHRCIVPPFSSRPPVSAAAGVYFRCMTTSGAASTSADEEYNGERLTENEARSKSEVDAAIIFDNVWATLVAKYGEEGLNFPQDILWLSGAPGSGKGVMTEFIMAERGISAAPIETSSILTSPEAKALKAAGQLVGDRTVIQLMFEQLLNPKLRAGCIVDGFPRTPTQAECMKMLFDKMRSLGAKYGSTPLAEKFPRPIFHVMVLFIEEDVSVERQLRRGREVQAHNRQVVTTGVGCMQTVRQTDIDPELARQRYLQFKEHVFGSLSVVKEKFHFHFIDALGAVADVQARIRKGIAYQSAMELESDTFRRVRRLPLASEVIVNARHALVARLDDYAANDSVLFDKVLAVAEEDFMNIIKRQALAGYAIIRSQNPVFHNPKAVTMLLDLLSERGFIVALDILKQSTPVRVDLKTGAIESEVKKVYKFSITFERPKIRRG